MKLVVAPFDAPGCLGRVGSRRNDAVSGAPHPNPLLASGEKGGTRTGARGLLKRPAAFYFFCVSGCSGYLSHSAPVSPKNSAHSARVTGPAPLILVAT